MHYENIQPAVFLSRPNRFTALCRNGEGEELVCHLRNTGRCAELLLPGTRVWVQYHPSPTRKTQYTLITVEKGSQLVNLDSLAPNRLFAEGARSGLIQIDGVGELRELRSEVKADDSRLDHRLTGWSGTPWRCFPMPPPFGASSMWRSSSPCVGADMPRRRCFSSRWRGYAVSRPIPAPSRNFIGRCAGPGRPGSSCWPSAAGSDPTKWRFWLRWKFGYKREKARKPVCSGVRAF